MENHHIILEPLNKLHGYFEYLSPKNELDDLHSAIQRVFAKEIADGKITVTLVKVKKKGTNPSLPWYDRPTDTNKIRCGQSSK